MKEGVLQWSVTNTTDPNDTVVVQGGFRSYGDVDGDGVVDLFGYGGATFFGKGAHNMLLSRVVDGLGNLVEVDYGDSYATDERCKRTRWPDKCFPRMNGLVSSHQEGFVGAATDVIERRYDYQYVNARMNMTGHGWLGFDQRKVTRSISDQHREDEIVTTDYEPVARYTPAGVQLDDAAIPSPPYLYPFAGLPKTVTIQKRAQLQSPLNNAFYNRRVKVENDWTVKMSAWGRPFPFSQQREVTTWNDPPPSSSPAESVLLIDCYTTFSDPDGYANVPHQIEACQRPNLGDYIDFEQTYTDTSFEIDPANWLISNPVSLEIANRRVAFDSPQTQNWLFTYEKGAPHTVTRASDNEQSDAHHKTTYERNEFGNVKKITEEAPGERPRNASFAYDDDNVYPLTVTNALEQTTQLDFDPRWGLPSGTIDPNGIATQRSYDGFGRVYETHGPTGSSLTTYDGTGQSVPSAIGILVPRIDVTTERRGPNGALGGRQTSELDRLGRVVRSVTLGFRGKDVIEERAYDGLSRLIAATLPHTADAATPATDQYSYDFLDRVTRVEHSDHSAKTYQYGEAQTLNSAYSGWTSNVCEHEDRCAVGVVLSVDEEGRKNVVITDHLGLVVRNIDGENVGSAQHTSDYIYGSFNRLIRATDNLGNVTRFFHDPYGRQTKVTDPDAGDTKNTFNGFDELVTTTDPSQQTRMFHYDDLGRRTTIVDPAGTTDWIYDLGPNAIGRLSETISPHTDQNPDGLHVHYSYEPGSRGLLQKAEYTLDGTVYPVRVDHDDFGRTQKIHYPDLGAGAPVVAQYSFEAGSGILTDVEEVGGTATKPLWHLEEAFQAHLVKHETFGNGASTTYGYNEGRRWLESIQTSLGPDNIQALDYTHYDNGLIHTRTDAGKKAEFLYDNLNRLSFVNDLSATPPTSVPYSYDAIGNLTGRGSTTIAYQSGAPHFVDTAGKTSYRYDANGNVYSRFGSDVPGSQQFIDYTPFDLPSVIRSGAKSARFEYSADEERLVRRDDDTTRYFVGELYQRLVTSGTNDTLEERFRLYAGGRQLGEIVRKNGSDETLFFHADAIGTVDTISKSDNTFVTQKFDVFGAPIDPVNPAATRAGFTGQQHDDDLGVIDMRGRMYDPLAGRFASADPVMQSPFWSQGLNRYSYAFNDPVNNVDPSGFDTFYGGGSFAQDTIYGGTSYVGYGGAVPGAGGAGAIAGKVGGAGLSVGFDVITQYATGTGLFEPSSPTHVSSPGPAPSAAPAATGFGQGTPHATAQNQPLSLVTPQPEGAPAGLGCPGQGYCHDPPSDVRVPPLSAEQVFDFFFGGLESPVNAAGPGDVTYNRTSTLVFVVSVATLVGGPKFARGAGLVTKTERIAEHLTQRDLSAAAREAAGHIVAVKPTGAPFNHILEVREAQQGLLNRIDTINRALSRSTLNSVERAELEAELSKASRLLDYSERYLPR